MISKYMYQYCKDDLSKIKESLSLSLFKLDGEFKNKKILSLVIMLSNKTLVATLSIWCKQS